MLERSPLHNPLGGLPAGAGDASVGRADAEERFPALLESAPDAMVIVDRAGLIRLVNAQTEAIFGYRSGRLVRPDPAGSRARRRADRRRDRTKLW